MQEAPISMEEFLEIAFLEDEQEKGRRYLQACDRETSTLSTEKMLKE